MCATTGEGLTSAQRGGGPQATGCEMAQLSPPALAYAKAIAAVSVAAAPPPAALPH